MKMGHSQPLFLYFCLYQIFIIQLEDKIFPMTGFELRISGVGSDRSTNCATTIAQVDHLFMKINENRVQMENTSLVYNIILYVYNKEYKEVIFKSHFKSEKLICKEIQTRNLLTHFVAVAAAPSILD